MHFIPNDSYLRYLAHLSKRWLAVARYSGDMPSFVAKDARSGGKYGGRYSAIRFRFR